MAVIDYRLGKARVDQRCVYWVRGMNKDDGAPQVEKVPRTPEIRMAKVVIGIAIAAVENDAICFKNVQGIKELMMHGARIMEGGDIDEEAVPVGVGVPGLGCVLIGLAAESGLFVKWKDAGAGSSD